MINFLLFSSFTPPDNVARDDNDEGETRSVGRRRTEEKDDDCLGGGPPISADNLMRFSEGTWIGTGRFSREDRREFKKI